MEVAASWPSKMPLQEVAAWARRIEGLGFDVMHIPETVHDPFVVASIAAVATERLTIRTSMVVAFPRSPMLTAVSAWDIAGLSGGRFQLGLASQVRGNIVGRFSTEWSEPVQRLGDYINSLRAIFNSFQTGADLNYIGSHYRFERLQPYFNPGPLEHGTPAIWSGGVNKRMCVLAGELSDGFVCHPTNSHPRTLRANILPALAEGITSSGREDGGPAIVAGAQPLMAQNAAELAKVREARRSELAFLYSTPAYRRQLEEFGLGDLGSALSEMSKNSEWGDLHKHLSDEVMDMLIPNGTYEEIPATLSRWYAGLCSGIVLAVPAATEHDEEYRDMIKRSQKIPRMPRDPFSRADRTDPTETD